MAVKLQSNASEPAPAMVKSAPIYKAAIVPVKFLPSDLFTEPQYIRDIQRKIALVIDAEAPVSQSTLVRRVVQSYGIARAGSRIQGHMGTILRKMSPKITQQNDVVFYWRQDQNPDAYVGFRVSGDGENRRDVRDIPVQEVANAIYTVLYEQVSMAQEDLLRETAKKLGYTRLGGNVLSQLALGIRYAEGQGRITRGTNGTYVLSADGTARAEATMKTFLSNP